MANFIGHDHTNDYGGFHKSEKFDKKIELVYGRKTGYGCYGPSDYVEKGGRVITLK